METEWTYRQLPAVIIDNSVLRVVVLPELGGKIWQITDVRSGRDLLWHNPRLKAHPIPFGSTYDDVFLGGWDELFPNDIPEVLAGESYPDHGEVWASPWEWSVEAGNGEGRLVMTLDAPISGCRLTKTVRLTEQANYLHLDSGIHNDGPRDLPFLWKHHVAVPAHDPGLIGLGARTTVLEDFGAHRAGVPGQSYAWPHLSDAGGRTIDMARTLPIGSAVSELHYATELDAGWCAITGSTGDGVGLAFDVEVFTSCWLFASYGGWRGHQVLVMEPCTGYPLSVSAGVAQGSHRILAAGDRIDAVTTLVSYTGFSEVTGITQDGQVKGRST